MTSDPRSPAAQGCHVGSVSLLPSLPRSEAVGDAGQTQGAAWHLLSGDPVARLHLVLRTCPSFLAARQGPTSSTVT